MGFFEKIKKGLSKTKSALGGTLDGVLSAFGVINDDLYDELEEALIMADIGVETTLKIISKLKTNVKEKKIKDAQGVRDELKLVMTEMLESRESTVALNTKPSVILLIGVNGVGKTTTAAKLAHLYISRGNSLKRGLKESGQI